MGEYELFDEVVNSMTDEAPEPERRFVIDNDQKAEWALKRIREEEEEADRKAKICRAEIMRYESMIADIQDEYERKTDFLHGLLENYFNTVSHKKTKTKETYALASGTMVLKHSAPKTVKDDDVLIRWLSENNPEYVKTEVITKPAWGEFKKTLTVSGCEYVTADGQIVEGVYAVEQPDVFTLEFGK